MSIYKVLMRFIGSMGGVIISSWLFVEIFGTEKIDPAFVVVGCITIIWSSIELKLTEIHEKLNERPK